MSEPHWMDRKSNAGGCLVLVMAALTVALVVHGIMGAFARAP